LHVVVLISRALILIDVKLPHLLRILKPEQIAPAFPVRNRLLLPHSHYSTLDEYLPELTFLVKFDHSHLVQGHVAKRWLQLYAPLIEELKCEIESVLPDEPRFRLFVKIAQEGCLILLRVLLVVEEEESRCGEVEQGGDNEEGENGPY